MDVVSLPPNENDCFGGNALMVDCIYGVTEVKTFISTSKKVKDSEDIGLLNIAYIVSQNTPFLDGMDPNVSVYLKFTYYVNNLLTFSKIEKVGRFFSFDGMKRIASGSYNFRGEIFSDEQGCMTELSYMVNAAKYTISIRNHNFSPEKIEILKTIENC